MGNNCHKSPKLFIEKVEKYFFFLLASECVRRASACLCTEAPSLLQFLWAGIHAQTGVTLYRYGLLHRSKKFLILNKDCNRGNE